MRKTKFFDNFLDSMLNMTKNLSGNLEQDTSDLYTHFMLYVTRYQLSERNQYRKIIEKLFKIKDKLYHDYSRSLIDKHYAFDNFISICLETLLDHNVIESDIIDYLFDCFPALLRYTCIFIQKQDIDEKVILKYIEHMDINIVIQCQEISEEFFHKFNNEKLTGFKSYEEYKNKTYIF